MASNVKLTKTEHRLLALLGEGKTLGLQGIGSVIAAQKLIDLGVAEVWLMGTVVITPIGLEALREVEGR